MTKILIGLGRRDDGPLDSFELVDLETSTTCSATSKFPLAKEAAFGGLGPGINSIQHFCSNFWCCKFS